MKKVAIKILSSLLCAALLSLPALAHSGRTDASGGHRDNKNVSGLGSYHYHHGYSAHLHPNGVCPYTSTAAAPEAPAVSIVPDPPAAPASTPASNTQSKQSPEILSLKAASKTPKPAFTSVGLKTDSEKAIFLDNYIAILTNAGVYHTIDCEDFDSYDKFDACDVSKALQRGYTPCPKCH